MLHSFGTRQCVFSASCLLPFALSFNIHFGVYSPTLRYIRTEFAQHQHFNDAFYCNCKIFRHAAANSEAIEIGKPGEV